ncbi:PREDICTED: GRIP [Prunus dulcis]|uniref:PREDICTED: GRIP n=1 Tax=Prunus dulcis TaxID=3755 RepID=A0A5E4E2J8_PRUDU|nr:hypothetical protein L3X38_039556 [Prunus dulcis]VVA10023.1 PREDICTED: GRIP [Prunus dulcis]
MLKAELRNLERTQKREGVDMTYLKNVILKLLETDFGKAASPKKRFKCLIPYLHYYQEEIEEPESMLKAELRNMERTQKRERVDMTYLKNVISKLLETDAEMATSVPNRASGDVPPSPRE